MEEQNEVVFPNPEKDYHGHPNYGKILLTLLALLAVSLILGFAISPWLAVILIFATALWKAALVMRNFMHLKYEPWQILLVVGIVLFVVLAFFFGVFPDITNVHPDIAK